MEETILSKLRNEHDEIEFLMDEVLIHHDPEERRQYFKLIKAELIPHMKAEDDTVYKRIREEISDQRTRELSATSEEEHHYIRECLQRLELLDISGPEWINEFQAFREFVLRHCAHEEEELFTEAKEDFSREELIDIGTEYEENKLHLS